MTRAANTISREAFARLTGGRTPRKSAEPARSPVPAPGAHRRVLGLDTALRCTGYGLVRGTGGRLAAEEYGAIRVPANATVTECLRHLYETVSGILGRTRPNAVAIEGAFFSRNVRTTLRLGEARGAVLAACAKAGIPVFEYPPRRVKQALVGTGAAQKEQVGRMVSAMLALPAPPQADAADALAIAICHLHQSARNSLACSPAL